MRVKVAGIWKDSVPSVKVAGVWKQVSSGSVRVAGVWKSFYNLITNSNDYSFTTFDTGSLFNSYVNTVAVQSDGKILVGGGFTTFNGVTVNRIVRLNADFSMDTAFTTNTGTGAVSAVNTVAIQPDGKILLGGDFTTFNGVTANRIARLNADGTRDTDFTTNTSAGANGTVYTIAVQPDGKILVGGQFNTLGLYYVQVNRIVRLNADGTGDTAFTTNAGTVANSNVHTIAVQSDGKILLGGTFTTFNGVTVNRIARLNADGTRDTAFTTNTGTGANNTVKTMAVQPDGKILVGGLFTTFNGVTVNRIARLNADGTRDTEFTTNTGSGANGNVNTVAIQPDGKILVGGGFSIFNGVTVNRIIQLNADGTRDTAFTTNTGSGTNGYVQTITVQPDGKILVGGAFTTFNGVTVNRIARLNADGTRDTSAFTVGAAANDTVSTIAVQSDGKILLGGTFTTFNGVTVNRIVRLNADGTRDTAFTTNTGTGANNTVYTIAVQPDGKILVGGQFTTFNGVTANRIVRLNADGTRDTAFTTNTGTGANKTVYTIAVQPDGKILVGGQFTTFSGVTVNRIARLNADGTRDTAFTTNNGTGITGTTYDRVLTIAIQPDGKILVGGAFETVMGVTTYRIFRLNSDGTRDTNFPTFIHTNGPNSTVNTMAVQSDGKILVGGNFSTFSSGVTVNFIVRLNADGTRDTAFTTNTGTGASSAVFTLAIQPDGKILVGGHFTTFNGVTVNRIVRLNADGSIDTAFTTDTGTGANNSVNTIVVQPDGKILVGGLFTSINYIGRSRIARLLP